MNLHVSFAFALWCITAMAQALLFFVCLCRRIHITQPWFFRYIAFELGGNFLLMRISDYHEYVACFYVMAIVSGCLKIAIIYSAADHVFSPFKHLPVGSMRKLLTCAVVAVSISSALIFQSRASNLDYSMNFLRTADTALTSGIVIGFWIVVIYARKFGLYWRSHVAGVVVGFLLFLSVQTATKFILLGVTGSAAVAVRGIGQLSYLMSVLAWLRFCVHRDTSLETIPAEAINLAKSLLNQSEAFLDHIADTCDRSRIG